MPRTLSPVEIASAAIELALKDIAPRWKADTIAMYERAATQEHENAIKRLTDKDVVYAEAWFKNKPPFRFVDLSEKFKKQNEYNYRSSMFPLWKAAAGQGEVVCLIENARQSGKHAYECAHHDFVFRCADKIGEVFGPGSELKADCKLTYSPGGAIEGVASASSGAGKLVVVVSVMTNYRYGENAADGVLTVYGQYPMRVASVTNRNGSTFDGVISLEEAAVLISGRNPVEEKRRAKLELKAKKKQRSDDLWALEKRKRVYDDIASTYRFDEAYTHHTDESRARTKARLEELCAKAGIALPPNKKAANEKVKELREQMKALKGAPL